jgi:hypothetical protein
VAWQRIGNHTAAAGGGGGAGKIYEDLFISWETTVHVQKAAAL